ncbi:MAG: TlpA family protein disulfide reductase [Jatrophihabitans sp.]|nr:MAG: TlpA family protein disulfide reductase [Jatrophihabitans sp.]
MSRHIVRGRVPLLATFLTGLLTALVSGCASGTPQRHAPTTARPAAHECAAPSAPAAPAGGLPALRIACLDPGPAVDIARLPGPAVVNLWASWCYPCQREMPLLQDAAERDHGAVRIVGVNTNDQVGSALSFVAKVGARYEQLSDPTGQLARALNAPGLPYTVSIDAAGAVVWHQAGVLTESDIVAAVRAAQRGPAADRPQTGGTR